MHSEMGAVQFGPTVTRVSNLQYESDEKSRDERNEGMGGRGGNCRHLNTECGICTVLTRINNTPCVWLQVLQLLLQPNRVLVTLLFGFFSPFAEFLFGYA